MGRTPATSWGRSQTPRKRDGLMAPGSNHESFTLVRGRWSPRCARAYLLHPAPLSLASWSMRAAWKSPTWFLRAGKGTGPQRNDLGLSFRRARRVPTTRSSRRHPDLDRLEPEAAARRSCGLALAD